MSNNALSVAHVNDIASVPETLALEQRRRGRRAIVIDPAKPGANLPFPWKLAAAPFRVATIGAAAARIRHERVDLVHVHYATQALVGIFTSRPYVVHCHGTDIRGLSPRSAWGRYVSFVLRGAAIVLYATPDLEGDVEHYRPDAVFLPNPIDVDLFSPAGSADRDLLIGVKLDEVKGAIVAIDSAAEVLRRRPSTTITVINSGSLARVARERLGDRAVFVDPRAHDEMPSLLARHRVTLGQFNLGILSQYELEAMATGLTVIADLRHPNPLASPAPVGQASTAEQCADHVVALLDDEPDRQRRAIAGRVWVQRNHAAEVVVDRLDSLYGLVT